MVNSKDWYFVGSCLFVSIFYKIRSFLRVVVVFLFLIFLVVYEFYVFILGLLSGVKGMYFFFGRWEGWFRRRGV